MAEPSEPLRDSETGLVGELARRPNPDGLVIWPMPPIESLIATRQQELGRELTAEEIETQRRKALAIVVTKDVADGIMAERARRPTTVQTTSSVRHPTVKSSYDAMPTEAADRNEAAVELFGQHVFSCRNALIERLRRLIESAETRGGMGTLHRKEFDAVAASSRRDAKLPSRWRGKRSISTCRRFSRSLPERGTRCPSDLLTQSTIG